MRSARRLGILVQALVLGVLLFLAVLSAVSVGAGRVLFRYEGF